MLSCNRELPMEVCLGNLLQENTEEKCQFSSNWTSKWLLLISAQNGCKPRHYEPWSKIQTKLFHFTSIFSGDRFPQGFSKTWKAVHSHLFHLTCSLVLQILLSSDKRQQNVCFPCQNWFCLTGIVVGSSCIEGSMPTFICVQGTGSPGAKWNRVRSLSRGKMDWMATLLMSLFSLRVQTLPVLGSWV